MHELPGAVVTLGLPPSLLGSQQLMDPIKICIPSTLRFFLDSEPNHKKIPSTFGSTPGYKLSAYFPSLSDFHTLRSVRQKYFNMLYFHFSFYL